MTNEHLIEQIKSLVVLCDEKMQIIAQQKELLEQTRDALSQYSTVTAKKTLASIAKFFGENK